MLHSKSVIAVPPGATIREQLEIRGMSQREFAQRMGLTENHISRLINGKVELTPDVALRLESVLGAPASFWNNLEAIYREQIARVIEHDANDAKQSQKILRQHRTNGKIHRIAVVAERTLWITSELLFAKAH